MLIDEELKMLNVVLSICEGIYKNIDKVDGINYIRISPDYKIRMAVDSKLKHIRLNSEGYSNSRDDGWSFIISDEGFSQLRVDDYITLNFDPSSSHHKTFSFLNSCKENLIHEEEFIDEFTFDGRDMTDEEYFQATLIHPDMPEYDTIKKYMKVMKEGSEVLNGTTFMLHRDPLLTLKLVRKLRRYIIHNFGVDIDVHR